MATKPGAMRWTVLEQIIEDYVSGIVFKFEARPDGEFALYIQGSTPSENRTFVFNEKGELAGTGTLLTSQCKPNWITEVSE